MNFPLPISEVNVGIMAAVGIIAGGDPSPPAARTVGLSYTPSYVEEWSQPANIALGKFLQAIPADAIEYETGNGLGGQFVDLWAWIDAANAADKPMAWQSAISFATLQRKYCKRGVYGAGAAKMTYTGRTTGTRSFLFHTYRDDVTIRGGEYVNLQVAATTYPTLRLLTDDGVTLDGRPYHAGNDPLFASLDSRITGVSGALSDGPAAGFHTVRLGQVVITGSVSISALTVVRQIPDSQRHGSALNYYVQANYDSILDAPLALFSGQACTTAAQVVTAINANSGSTTYRAELGSKGEVVVMPVSAATRAFIELNPTFTGTGTVATNNRTPNVELSHCTLTDCNSGYGAILDVMEHGVVKAHKNDCPGTWSLVYLNVTRWSDLYAANNNWRDCNLSRATATGRTNSRLPTGSSLTTWNTFIGCGLDTQAFMRYHVAGNDFRVENNRVRDVESNNNTDTVNCAVFVDVRSGWQRTDNGKIIDRAWNDIENLKGISGAEDCNVFYGKTRGGWYRNNRIVGFGAAWFSASFNGSECACHLDKNPGSFNGLWLGAYPEDLIFESNYVTGGPDGCPWFKDDENKTEYIFRGNYVGPWSNLKNGVEITAGQDAGFWRAPANQFSAQFYGNILVNVKGGPIAPWMLANHWNLQAFVPFLGERFAFHSNEFRDTVPRTSNERVVNFQWGGGKPSPVSTFQDAVQTGNNPFCDINGVPTGYQARLWNDNDDIEFTGSLAAPFTPFSSFDGYAQSLGL
jgi:hypothetical protein